MCILMCMACAWHVHGRWAGQLSIFRNTAESRALYRVVAAFVDLGFKVSP